MSNTSERSGFSSVWTSSQKASDSAIAQSARPMSNPPRSGMVPRLASAGEPAVEQRHLHQPAAAQRRAVDHLQHLPQFLLVQVADHASVVGDRDLAGLLRDNEA